MNAWTGVFRPQRLQRPRRGNRGNKKTRRERFDSRRGWRLAVSAEVPQVPAKIGEGSCLASAYISTPPRAQDFPRAGRGRNPQGVGLQRTMGVIGQDMWHTLRRGDGSRILNIGTRRHIEPVWSISKDARELPVAKRGCANSAALCVRQQKSVNYIFFRQIWRFSRKEDWPQTKCRFPF